MNASSFVCALLVVTTANAFAQQPDTGNPATVPVVTNPALPTTITIDGTTYDQVRWGRVTPATVTLFHKSGVATIALAKLPPDLQKQFNYNPQRAAEWQAAQQAAAADAARRDAEAAQQAAVTAQHAAAATEWQLTIERILPDGILAKGYKTVDYDALNTNPNARVHYPKSVSICLVEHPKVGALAEGEKVTAIAYQDGVIDISGRALQRWVYFDPLAPKPIRPQSVAAPFSELRQNGAFGFPQHYATMLWDQPLLRVSVWNNDHYLFVQAVLWTDNNPASGYATSTEQADDSSKLMLDLTADGVATPNVDRHYWLNRFPNLKGMYYQVSRSANSRTGMKHDSQGRGAIRFVDGPGGKLVRVDTYLIPLAELSKQVGDTIGLCYWGYSSQPPLAVSSIGYEATKIVNHTDNFSFSKAAQYTLRKGADIDVGKVPDGRSDNSLSEK